MRICILFLLLLSCYRTHAQDYPCEKPGAEVIVRLIGNWQVKARDRSAPGVYEDSQGKSEITWGINGCSIHETYKGTFKDRPYAVEYMTYLNDSSSVQRTFFDSEHSNLMWLNGDVQTKAINSIWFRDPDKKRMQVKNKIKIINLNSFENVTHLSTDYGKTWVLTHHWAYSR